MEHSERIEADVIAEIEQRQRAAAAEHADIVADASHRRRLEQISQTMPSLTPQQIAARDAEIAERERQRELYARHDCWRAFIRERGERYADCQLQNFAADSPKQVAAVKSLEDYGANITDRIADGEGIILFGPKGTGKDHLLVALCRIAILAGKRVTWQNGMDLFGDMRDRMDSGDSERALVSRLVRPDVLYLSDPVPPIGKLTEYQAGMIFRILDGRYSRARPIWCSVNTSSGPELEERMGSQNVDRLRDRALSIHCDWPSWRKVSNHITA